ncbi:GNAT family protein [Gordonia jinhuaensis]|uniref:N-acetyltransferase n=1 Tax=Gordonia jinhuaensis TaxID=1517702 RepID=A0A916T9Q8_9ACTN|nr:GNAT family protein [Gordonia jinhuaensis]GGB34497.1 N-acetyltransferase [Gordonia jinhuaensis]
MIDFPIVTRRVVLSPLTTADLTEFVAYRRDPGTARFQSWTTDYSRTDAAELVAGQPDSIASRSGQWLQIGVRLRDAPTLVGDLAVHALAEQPDTYEVGVTVAPAGRGRGLATEALDALVGELFETQRAHRVCAITDVRNAPAAALLTRLGFRHEGRAVEADWCKGEWTSTDSWAMLRRDAGQSSSSRNGSSCVAYQPRS